MIKIGITGNIACGKSTAEEVIKSAGYPVVDCDDIVKSLYSNEAFITEISKNFPQIIKDKKIDLKTLSECIFSDNSFKTKYEKFVFPKVKEKILEFYEENKNNEKIFIVAPLLFEAGYENLFDKIIFISADENDRRERLASRGTTLSNMAEKVIKSQSEEEGKIPLCDYVIKNNSSLEEFKSTVKKLIFSI